MKKSLLSFLLALCLVFSGLCQPVFAEEVATGLSETVEGESLPSESTEPEIIYTIPQNVVGDASIVAGTNTISAAQALMPVEALELDVKAALMYELNTGTLVYAMNADEQLYPASVTKVMTCLVALDKGNLDDIVTVSQHVVDTRDPNGSNAQLKVEEKMTLRELLYCLMVASANDAASAISEHIAGSEEAFVQMMNDKALELGCTNTHFANPHGLHDEEHYTCARDLARILMAALEHEEFHSIYSAKSYEIPATNKSEARELVSTNYMIQGKEVDHYLDTRAVGGKTGFTTPAGRCFVGVAESGDMKLLTVVLGGKTGYNDYGALMYGSFDATSDLIDYGFENFRVSRILSPEVVVRSVPVENGENDTQAVVQEPADSLIPIDLGQDDLQFEYGMDREYLTAPVEAGESLGFVRVWFQGKCIAQQDLYTSVASPERQPLKVSDPPISNPEVNRGTDVVQVILLAVIGVLVLVVVILALGYMRLNHRRAKRRQRRNNRRSR